MLELNTELIFKIKKDWEIQQIADSFDNYLCSQFKLINNLQADIREQEELKCRMKRAFTTEMNEISREINRICQSCPHYITKYHPDPSGNNDSHTECLICGYEI